MMKQNESTREKFLAASLAAKRGFARETLLSGHHRAEKKKKAQWNVSVAPWKYTHGATRLALLPVFRGESLPKELRTMCANTNELGEQLICTTVSTSGNKPANRSTGIRISVSYL